MKSGDLSKATSNLKFYYSKPKILSRQMTVFKMILYLQNNPSTVNLTETDFQIKVYNGIVRNHMSWSQSSEWLSKKGNFLFSAVLKEDILIPKVLFSQLIIIHRDLGHIYSYAKYWRKSCPALHILKFCYSCLVSNWYPFTVICQTL